MLYFNNCFCPDVTLIVKVLYVLYREQISATVFMITSEPENIAYEFGRVDTKILLLFIPPFLSL